MVSRKLLLGRVLGDVPGRDWRSLASHGLFMARGQARPSAPLYRLVSGKSCYR